MSTFHKLLRRISFLAAACALLSLEGTPAQQQPQQPQPPPRFAFVETGPIILAPGQPASETRLQNNTTEVLDVVVEVVDLLPKGPHPVSAAVEFPQQTVRLPPAGVAVIKINPPPESVAEFGPGYLIAVEAGKLFDRREIKSRTPAKPQTQTPTPVIVEPSVPVDSLQTVNLPGINFLPSFTSRLSPISPWLLLLLFLLFIVWVRRSPGIRRSVGGTLLAAAAATLFFILLGALVGYEGLKKTPSAVIVPPASLTSPQKSTGGVISADGSLGKLEADGFQLKATGIPRAGVYEGGLKVTQGQTTKDVKVVTNVSDWWPYALLAITVGVLLGYHLARYFKQQRGEDEQRVRAAQLWLRVSEEESRFQLGHGGQPFAAYSIALAAKNWLAAAEGSIAAHDTAAAKTRLDRLDAYVNLFEQFRGHLLALDTLQARVWELIRRHEPNLAQNRAGIKVFRETDEALRAKPLDFTPDEEQQSTTLKAYQAKVQASAGWLEALEKTITIIDNYLRVAEALGWGEDTRVKLRKARRDAITAVKKDDVLKAEDEATAAAGEVKLEDMAVLNKSLPASDERAQPAAKVELSYNSLAAEDNGRRDPDDLFIFTANVTSPADLRSYRLWWDFDDGTTSDVPASALGPGETVPLQVSHRYRQGGTYKVGFKRSPGNVLAESEVTVSKGTGRAQRLLAAFRLTEWQMSVIAGLIAVGLGFYTLYLSKTVWGTPADYLNAVLWGSVVSEGLKYAAGLVDRVWAK